MDAHGVDARGNRHSKTPILWYSKPHSRTSNDTPDRIDDRTLILWIVFLDRAQLSTVVSIVGVPECRFPLHLITVDFVSIIISLNKETEFSNNSIYIIN